MMIADKVISLKKILAQVPAIGTSYIIAQRKGQCVASELKNNEWQGVSLKDIAEPSIFSRRVVLIPEHDVAFYRQEFSADLVSEKDLDEAVALNLESWSPYGENSQYFIQYEKKQGQWLVATWVWSLEVQEQLISASPDQQCTHIMPETAWYCGRVTSTEPVVLLLASERGSVYIHLNATGLPLEICTPDTPTEVMRFWRSMGASAGEIKQLLVMQESLLAQPSDLPKQLQVSLVKKLQPKARWLKWAQIAGLNDWLNPRNWLKPSAYVLSLLIVWVVADAMLLNHQRQQLSAFIAQVKITGQDVLTQQDEINGGLDRLAHYAELKQRQTEPEYILAELSKRIPSNIWLDAVQLDNSWLDIRGRGTNVISLLGLLEVIEGVEDVVLLNDVRPDLRTGYEQFQIRIILANQTQARKQQ